jgi:hypothetical protein
LDWEKITKTISGKALFYIFSGFSSDPALMKKKLKNGPSQRLKFKLKYKK